MCGFAGFIELTGPSTPRGDREAILQAMSARLARRGPDGEQRYDDDHLAFVFRRLAIVDLETGDQPIWNEDRSLFVAVNGEIYNHQDLRTALEKSGQLEQLQPARSVTIAGGRSVESFSLPRQGGSLVHLTW